ncbi:unnamed protein product [Polarella glacialis]|uniref:Uncharacterized protein n=1 Tax=Polarella glacialis TaxID=89957 RepID=A0A813KGK0_POLGL|nr:unnamed protein product [Polarella glacialis]CAE8700103.1 unnamed protein product [Polarella glacialis]|mmetsp:Transcript_30495/g.48895  ORF Transcript_30495/g.48895 Transcript_30495/m.48895 type:complete len:458 (-) Transcript_30495:269-1642(-)
MLLRLLATATLCLSWRAAFAAASLTQESDLELANDAVLADDECAEAGNSDCALNAIQIRGQSKTSAVEVESRSSYEAEAGAESEALNQVSEQQPLTPQEEKLGAASIWNYRQNCWTPCNKQSGNCENFCGPGNACCRYGRSGPPECTGVKFWPSMSFHTCVIGTAPLNPNAIAPKRLESMADAHPSKQESSAYYKPENLLLTKPSTAPVLSFYVYRAMSDSNFPPENVNAANLDGVMWYLHNEVVVYTPRKFDITRILRFKVTYKAPEPLFDKDMNFGVRYAFDSGRCTGPGNCNADFKKYGYFVGCNYVWQYPTAQFKDAVYYPNSTWYSFPGPCSDRDYRNHDTSCVQQDPGGACSGTPSGQGDCTYNYEPAGEVKLDEIVGMREDYTRFVGRGGREYVRGLDMGLMFSFWNFKQNVQANERRVAQAQATFAKKYPDSEVLDGTPCDFDYGKFYR